MAKRKKIAFDDSSDEEVIRTNKRSKKEASSKKKTPTKKRKVIESDSDSDSDDYKNVTISKPAAKKTTGNTSVSKKPAAKTTTSKAKGTTSKEKSTAAIKKKPATNSKDKLVKISKNDESSEDENAIDCKMVKKQDLHQPKIVLHNETNFTNGDKKTESLMWVDKYKPKEVSNIIGMHTPKCNASKLKYWLQNWHKNKDVKVNSAKNDTGIGLKAALLSGPPGIGKTTTAHLVAKECGFEFVEYNASDTRNKKSMDEYIQTLLGNQTLEGFLKDPKGKTKMTSKHVIIMDEVDGMSGADRGGIAELIQFIKKTKVPIICICNDRNNQKIRSLAYSCFDLRFTKPRTEWIKKMLLSICEKEKVKIASDVIDEIIEMSNHDIRQILHYFSIFSQQNHKLDDIKKNRIIKDIKLGPFDAVKKLFSEGPEYEKMSMKEKSDLFFNDYSLMPIFAFENYQQCQPTKTKNATETLDLAAKSINAICVGDLIETQIRTTQNWSLLPIQSIFSCVMPGYYMNGHFTERIEFPSILGKFSATGRKERLCQELKFHMNLKITGSKSCLTLDYLLPLQTRIVQPLIRNLPNAVENAIETLNHYCLLKDDLDSINELCVWGKEKSIFANVDSKVKASLTRTFNKNSELLPYASKDMISKAGKGKAKKVKKGEFDDENEEEEEEEPIQDNDDKLIPEF